MKTTCPYCGVGCGVHVTRGDDGFKVIGDADHPANNGRLCSKGSALAETLGHSNRLLQPEVDGQSVSWAMATDHIAERLNQTIETHGRDSVAFYVSGQILIEDYYVANKLTKGWLGTANIDTNSRLCMASSVVGHKRAFGSDTVPGNYEDLELADLIVLVGSNLAWCHPVLYQRIAAAKEKRPEMFIVVIDPRRTVSADAADLYLPIAPDTDAALFNGLLAYLGKHDAFDDDYVKAHVNGLDETLQAASGWSVNTVAAATGVGVKQVEMFYRRFCETDRTVTVYSQGVNQSRCGTDKVNAIINCHLATGRIGRPGCGPFSVTGQPNAMGGREVGGLATMLACHMELNNPAHRRTVQNFWRSPRIADATGLCAVDMFDAVADGSIKAIWIMGTNPVDSLPDADAVKAALKACPLVIVSDISDKTDTLDCASVKLPAHAWGEKDGTVTNSERCISRQRQFTKPAGQSRADWWALATVARKMGFAGAFDYQRPADIFREYAALSGMDNAGQRDFDISACANISDADYDALAPFYWPAGKGENANQPRRFFGNGGFFTSDRRACMLPIDAPDAARPVADDGDALILNTGRNRDQWHTMTRTGYSARLSRHLAEPYLALHPDDARNHGIDDADLVRVSAGQSHVLLRALLSDRQQRGHVFAPIHWSEQFAANARIDTLIRANVDPFSKQPAFKNHAVTIARYVPKSYAYGVVRHKPILRESADIGYWAIAPVDGGWQVEAAGALAVDAFARLLSGVDTLNTAQTCAGDIELLTHNETRGGVSSAAVFVGSQLHALVFAGDVPVRASRSWAQQQLTDDATGRHKRWQWLAGRAADSQPDKGAIVCSCHLVGISEIERAVVRFGCADLNSIGNRLQAGTNCGSCRSEIQSIIQRCDVTVSDAAEDVRMPMP